MADEVWACAYKIPWDDAAFSRRMLAEHLSQEHDLASRRTPWIDRQVAWIHGELLAAQPSSVLDLGCGPGFYAHRLALLGHRCRGIDFGPASIEYACRHAPGAGCAFVLGDIRQVSFGGPFDLAMLLYGEMNVFPPAELRGILRRLRESLTPGGRLILETQTAESIECAGRGGSTVESFTRGLFSESPYSCRTDCQWLPEARVAVRTFTIQEAAGGMPREYRDTVQAWNNAELRALLTATGFHRPEPRADWPCNTGSLVLWSGHAD